MALSAAQLRNSRVYRERHRERINAKRAAARAADPDFNRKCREYAQARRAAGFKNKTKRPALTAAQKTAKNLRARERRAANREAARAADRRQYETKLAKNPDMLKTFYARRGGRKYLHRETLGVPDTAWTQKHCDVCGAEGQRAVIDHCHQTKQFRGVLCDRCNLLLGQLERAAKQPALLAYAKRHGVQL